MTYRLGLTGSIGMGKTTTAKMFGDVGCAVWDADAAVHRLYEAGGAAVGPIGTLFPDAVIGGSVSRPVLRSIIAKDPAALKQIERVVHPLVAQDRVQFLDQTDADIVVFDIPLLFETNAAADMDAVACVEATAEIQKERVLARGEMTGKEFEQMLTAQMPSDEKCARSDFVIRTDTLEHARAQVQDIVRHIRQEIPHA